jgi:DNA-directed RNA polymerase specialized sigma24 family protein
MDSLDSNAHILEEFNTLYASYKLLVHSIISRSLAGRGAPMDAKDDISQVVWIECWQALSSGKTITKGWLTVSAEHRVTDHLRTLESRREVPLQDQDDEYQKEFSDDE